MDFEFSGSRLKDGGPVKNWIADRAITFADWLYAKYFDYALFYVMEFEMDEDDE